MLTLPGAITMFRLLFIDAHNAERATQSTCNASAGPLLNHGTKALRAIARPEGQTGIPFLQHPSPGPLHPHGEVPPATSE